MERPLTLTEFIARRRQELTAEEGKLRQRLQDVLSELQRLDEAEATSARSKTDGSHTSRVLRRRLSAVKPGTIMESVLNVLTKHDGGLSAMDILREIRMAGTHGMLQRESLSPQLSRLRQSGYIDLDGSVWKLRKKETE
jgi:hypothetical protein